MLVMPLPWLCVVSPRLRDLEVYLVLGVVDSGEVIRQRGFNKVSELGQFLVPQDRVIHRGRVAHVRPSLLALDEVNLFLGQITIKFVDADRGGE